MSKVSARPGETVAGPEGHDSEKRRQILDGAREVFRAKGYEGAAMDAIAKAAGVSKGTLYVYFTNKDELFEELITDEKRELAAALDAFEPTEGSFRDNLRAFAISFNELLTGENHMSSIRMVVGAVEKFPAVGAMFFRAGAERGTTRLTEAFARAIEDGRLKPCDPAVAAQHFIALCTSEVMKKSLFGCGLRPTPEGVERIVDNGLDVFMAYYGRA
ncbi:Transcriptional regulator [uncultured Pleomorphomonas sp.]|uniref:Transcriptional regulator n=1 Tax=uncultured Pleomorphomonas sp. TaxID=442121 RepID=A0A212L165_9HYPH|nr:TetR/AcrR family transcriptional regulator [uncultured Pleomorphomonas sp.]SCM71301.1 Transcriptional regulator [uncultured Pleomorphomonas sp.]